MLWLFVIYARAYYCHRPVEVVLDDVDILLYKLDGREKLKSARKAGFGDQVPEFSDSYNSSTAYFVTISRRVLIPCL